MKAFKGYLTKYETQLPVFTVRLVGLYVVAAQPRISKRFRPSRLRRRLTYFSMITDAFKVEVPITQAIGNERETEPYYFVFDELISLPQFRH